MPESPEPEEPHTHVERTQAQTPTLAPKPPRRFWATLRMWIADYFIGADPTFGFALVPYALLSMALYTRHPAKTNFIFDEQEALLANPYVRSIADAHPKFRWIDAFYRDFWGLGPERSIGSYRPIPDLVWRALWGLGAQQTPLLHHWVNVVLHAVNGALVCLLVLQLTKNRRTAWLSGAAFTACAVLTEAVSGVVGIADVLGATGVLLALLALALPMPWMALGVFCATLFGLYSKESALCAVPLVPATALLTAQIGHPEKPRRWARALVACAAAFLAFVLYVEARRRMFSAHLPSPLYPELPAEANAHEPWSASRAYTALLRWYAQPTLPKDPLNNPLASAPIPYRISGALRVYFRGLLQIVFPYPLSGDYSAPQEPVPLHLWSIESGLGGLAMVLPLPVAAWLGVRARHRTRSVRPAIAAALLWIPISYFPVSNIPVLLPTVRAERFWYFPAIGTSVLLGIALSAMLARSPPGHSRGSRRARGVTIGVVIAFFGLQAVAARRHANDYTDDLAFWDATRKAVPRSAKAHLNYSVMKGARGDLKARLEANKTALDLAPEWPMAHVYLGDTLCRLHRAEEAWPHYVEGFERAPNDVNLIALALQCLWDEKMLTPDGTRRAELDAMRDKHPGTWFDYLVRDILEHGDEHGGVDPKYRPRGYNEGPKE
ncbi:MAG: tetratricopeptide repeat protein [Polyangiaceae bacterium]|nr:tetratricopeptide repeat protein [Polyangiaceae bacterium]